MELIATFFGFLGLGVQYFWKQIDLNFDEVFLRVLDMTKTGILVIFAVLLLRWLLRKAPKVCSYVLWAVVLFRLLCPISLETQWAVLPEVETGESYTLANDDITFAGAAGAAVRAVGDAANGGLGIQHIRTANDAVVTSYWWEVWVLFGKYVWAVGMLAMVVYAVVSYGKLRKKLHLSMPLPDGSWASDVVRERPKVFLADGITTAFVVGLFRPKVYLPSGLSGEELDYILRHERHHIKRGDHIWKLLGFAALCIHWFNPLVWLAFRLAEKDMEMSCDEAVLKQLGPEIRKNYSASLLRLATGKRFTVGIPLAFGEGDTGDRVKHVMKYKKPALWLTIGAVVLALLAVVLLSANQSAGNTELLASVYRADLIVYSSDGIGGITESGSMYAVSADYQLYRKNQEAEPWTHLGTLERYELSKDEVLEYTAEKNWTTSYRLREITDAWYLPMENDMFYLVFQTKNGDTLLGYGWEDMGERGQGASDDTSLTFLYRLNATGDAQSTMGLTMTSILGGPLDSWSTYRSGDYRVWAFSAGEEYKDWGYAVYKEYDGAFKLLDWHLYENAAFVQNDIYVCPDPAVLSDDGTMTNENTYDVILNCNMQLDRIVRTVTVDGEVYHTVEKENINGSSMILFNWADQNAPKPHSVSQHFYDKWGGEIEVSSLTPEDILLSIFHAEYPNVEPVDWVLVDDGAEDLLGVVLYTGEDGQTKFVFVKDAVCGHVGVGAQVIPESELIYEGDATVSVVLQGTDGTIRKNYMSYTYSEEEITAHFDSWAEPIEG